MQAGEDVGNRQCPHPRRGELDRQRHAVKALTDLRHRGGILVGDDELGPDQASTVGEQLNRFVGDRQR